MRRNIDPELRDETWKSFLNLSANLAFKVLGFGIGFVFQILYARTLGLQGLSRIGLAMGIAAIATVLGSLSLDTALTRFAPALRGQPDFHRRLGGHLAFTLRATFPVGLASTLFILLFRDRISAWISPGMDVRMELSAVAPLVFFSVWSMQEGGAMRAAESFVAYSLLNDFLPRLVQGLSYLILWWITAAPTASFLAAYAAGVVLPLLLKWAQVRRELGSWSLLPPGPIGAGERRAIVIFGTKGVVYSLLATSMAQTTRLLLGSLGVTEGVGILMVIESLSLVLAFVRDSMGTVFNPQIARLAGTGSTEVMLGVYRRLSRWALIASLPYTLALVCNRESVLSLYGPSFAGGAPALVVLLWAQFIVVAMGLNGNILYMTGGENLFVVSQAICLGAVVGLGRLLIPRFGLVGGATAMATGVLLMNCILMVGAYLRLRASQFDRNTWRTVLAGVVVAAGVWAISGFRLCRPVALDLMLKVSFAYALAAVAFLTIDRRLEDMDVLRAVLARLRLRGRRLGLLSAGKGMSG